MEKTETFPDNEMSKKITNNKPMCDESTDTKDTIISDCIDKVTINNEDKLINKQSEEEQSEPVSHTEIKMIFERTLGRLFEVDPILKDQHPQVTIDEVEALIELEHGRAMTIYIMREDGDNWKVVVPRTASVHQLKMALKHHANLSLNRQGIKKKISWNYIWKSFWLKFEDTILTDDQAKLLDVGIQNKSCIRFVKQFRQKRSRKYQKKST